METFIFKHFDKFYSLKFSMVNATAVLPPDKTWWPLYWRLGGPQNRCGQVNVT